MIDSGVSEPSAARNVSLDYLRATLTVLVVAHHSSLAYTTFASSEPGSYLGGTAPIVDAQRWVFLDHAQNFNDVFFMSAMFFISGLFVWGSLTRRRPLKFLRERMLRLGVPFVVSVLAVMPAAYFAAWLFSGGAPNYLAYWRQNLLADGFSPGPLWFIWVLFVFNVAIAILFPALSNLRGRFEGLAGFGERHPLQLAAAILVVCALAYVPLLAAYGPSEWTAFVTGPFYFQVSRIALYFVWFVIGCAIGAAGIGRGLLNPGGEMAQRAGLWFLAAAVIFLIMEFVPRALFDAGLMIEDHARALYDGLWLISCVASTLAFLALFLKFVKRRNGLMDQLAHAAYAIYIVHYVFVLWIQYALLESSLSAGLKFAITFAGGLVLSHITALILLRFAAFRAVL